MVKEEQRERRLKLSASVCVRAEEACFEIEFFDQNGSHLLFHRAFDFQQRQFSRGCSSHKLIAPDNFSEHTPIHKLLSELARIEMGLLADCCFIFYFSALVQLQWFLLLIRCFSSNSLPLLLPLLSLTRHSPAMIFASIVFCFWPISRISFHFRCQSPIQKRELRSNFAVFQFEPLLIDGLIDLLLFFFIYSRFCVGHRRCSFFALENR